MDALGSAHRTGSSNTLVLSSFQLEFVSPWVFLTLESTLSTTRGTHVVTQCYRKNGTTEQGHTSMSHDSNAHSTNKPD